MDKKDEALKLALEALEDARTELCEWSSDVNREDYNNPRLNDAITAILAAQAEQPAQQKEPFGHVTVRRLSQRFENHHDQYHFYPAGQPPYLDNVDECYAVYTSPPASKPWVGLTDEDLSVCDEDGVMLARYWERVLREKNNG